MKTIILKSVACVVFVLTGILNTNLNAQSFVSNEVITDGLVASKIIYRHEGSLYHHMKYDFTYNEDGKVIVKEVLKWNTAKEEWAPYYKMNISYTSSQVSIDYSRWNESSKTYGQPKTRSTYELDVLQSAIALQSYKWNSTMQDWVISSSIAFNNDVLLTDYI